MSSSQCVFKNNESMPANAVAVEFKPEVKMYSVPIAGYIEASLTGYVAV
jgi:hypothetical protein